MYLAKLNELLSFINTTKQTYNLNIFSHKKPKNISKKLKNEFSNCSGFYSNVTCLQNILFILRSLRNPATFYRVGK